MVKIKQRGIALLSVLWLVAAVAGCIDQPSVDPGEILIRIGDRVATMDDFNRVLEAAEFAYSGRTIGDPLILRETRVGALNQLIEEMILLDAAETHGIAISDAELETAVKALKADYPEDLFEQMFLENAVSYESWAERLRLRVLADKVAETVLKGRIAVSPEDISAYYRENYSKDSPQAIHNGIDAGITEGIVEIIRREKKEKAYTAWLKSQKSRLLMVLNQEQWTKIVGEKAYGGTGKQVTYQTSDIE